jgi:hypothetical protein
MRYLELYNKYKSKYNYLKGSGKGDSTSRERKKTGKGTDRVYSGKHVRQREELRERFAHLRTSAKQTYQVAKKKHSSKSKSKR